MLKGRGQDHRGSAAGMPSHLATRPPAMTNFTRRTLTQQPKAPLAKSEPDYEVVEFPSDQYVNAKLQPPPPPPPRPTTNHPAEAGASCGLCGGGGARVRCAECGRRALCASCDDMYHRHPKRRHHQRQALSSSQLKDERPPLPPKTAPPVPPPRRHKIDRSSASPRPPGLDQRRATLGHMTMPSHASPLQGHPQVTLPLNNHTAPHHQIPPHLQSKLAPSPATHAHLGSMPYLPTNMHHAAAPVNHPQQQIQSNTMSHLSASWGRQRGSMPSFNVPPNMNVAHEAWESPESISPTGQSSPWGRPLRRGASVLELGGASANAGAACPGCAHCGPAPTWRYGSCASLDHPWAGAWPPSPAPPCCLPHPAHMHPHSHIHPPQTPQPYRRADSRAVSRAASRTGSRAASPAMSVRSRASRRTKHRTPSPPPLPSSDADSESESDSPPRKHSPSRKNSPARKHSPERKRSPPRRHSPTRRHSPVRRHSPARRHSPPRRHSPIRRHSPVRKTSPIRKQSPIRNAASSPAELHEETNEKEEDSLGPAPPPPSSTWQCEHCTFVNEPGVRVCAVCCRTPTTAPKVLAEDVTNNMSRLKISSKSSPSPVRQTVEDPRSKQNGEVIKRQAVERASTGCGPSPPREETLRKPMNRLETPTKEQEQERVEITRVRHDMGVGPSPPRENQSHSMSTGPSPPREAIVATRASPYFETKVSSPPEPPKRHNVSVGPSPPRENTSRSSTTLQKKSTSTSPPRETMIQSRASSTASRAKVSNTGTSPPPQSISTQTYEVPNSWERAPSVSRSRPRRRFRDESRRERSHSRHSLSSDTRESDRSVRTSGGGRWEWRETRDSSPGGAEGAGGEWSESERRRGGSRLTRRASHLDLRRDRDRARTHRRASFYGSEAASPEPLSTSRTLSLEALMGTGARREAERGLELARLMTEAERMGFSAAEVHAALAQNPVAPLSWLRERWPSLCAGVRAAAARLAPGAAVSELEARAALARHRGAMWPAVTDCVERHRRQTEVVGVGEEGRLRGRVWGSPAGADDDAAPPAQRSHRARAEDSSDEFEAPPPAGYQDDDWMYLPLEPIAQNSYEVEPNIDAWSKPPNYTLNDKTEEIAQKFKSFLIQSGVPLIDDNLLLKGLLADNSVFKVERDSNEYIETSPYEKPQSVDLVQSEIDFIDAYNALTRSSPLPNIKNTLSDAQISQENYVSNVIPNVHDNTDLQTNNNVNVNNVIATNEISDDPVRINHNVFPTTETVQSTTKVNDEVTINIQKEVNTLSLNTIVQQLQEDQEENVIIETTKITDTDLQTQAASSNDRISPESVLHQPIHSYNTIDLPNITKSNVVTTNNSSSHESILAQQDNSFNIENVEESQIITSSSKFSSEPVIYPTNETNILTNPVVQKVVITQEKSPKLQISDAKTLNNLTQNEDEKTSNLSDIVDNTQRLIQLMKEEINSDINSLDGRSVSQSEAENSSNESDLSTEHDSSYTESEGETDDLTSEEKENSSSEDNDNIRSERSLTVINRTSSEDNEQFEEAMDHIEERAESFKQTNIEILDSIARSLQEEHTILIQVNQDKESDTKNQQPQPKQKTKRQDFNNNSFAAVNSFEEIYEQLNTADINEKTNNEQPRATNVKSLNGNMKEMKTVLSPKIILIKQDIQFSSFKPITPAFPVVSQNHEPIFKAVVENIELLETTDNSNRNTDIADAENAPDNNILRSNVINEENNIELESPSNEILDHNFNNSEELEKLPINSIEQVNASSNYVPTEVEQNTLNDNHEGNNDDHKLSDTSQNSISPINVFTVKESHGNNHEIEHTENDTMDTSNISESNILIKNEEMQIQNNAESTTMTPEKAALNFPNNNNVSRNPLTAKSSIPKLVKTLPNSKQKQEKSPPKVSISKVPVRRGSLKQYPAPSPPKSHFGNIQSGHVRQLQTRLFNSKTPKVNVNPIATTQKEAVATTSTLNKKRPAPPPPSKELDKPLLQKNESPPKEKKSHYFRETCRTEDEWTESDSEDSRLQIGKSNYDEPQPVPSPPPPITLRRVSGQLIDLARVRFLDGSPERQARMLLAEGATENWEQAQLAVELVARGADPPAALLAALECMDLTAALAYLHQDCELCASRLPEHEMVSMLRCTHRCCRECARHYFTVQITERSIADCVCPYCKEPELESLPEDAWLEYFAHLDILLKTLLDSELHELFQRKLRDRTLARDPNFRWCVECSSGFFVHPKQKKIRCPECRSVSCANCRKPWSANHEGLSCEQYAAWLEDNDPERSVAAVQQHLRENGLECPRCHFKYSLSRGGCMHFTCTQCKYEFCYGCGKPFMMGARCGLSEYCAKLGLHAHHPRNCLFYLRDKEPHELQTLLQMNNVTYETEAAEGSTGRCPVQLQRETPTGLVDGACGSEVPPNHAGLCKMHYVEYLAGLARGLDPIPIMEVSELVAELRRRALPLPERGPWDTDPIYAGMCAEIVKEKIPLD